MCKPKIPKPDPLIGQAAKQNADIAQQQLDVAKQQLAWERERAAVEDPLVRGVVNQQIRSGDANEARAADQWSIYQNRFKPVEERMVGEDMSCGYLERKERMAA